MKKDYVYVAGPMEDCSEDHMKGWRQEVADQLDMAGIDVLDPTRRVSFHDQMESLQEVGKDSQSLCRRIFKMDLQDIANSTVIIADVRRSSGRGTGTSMELMFAHTKNKTIILWADEGDFIHPFYESIYTEKYFSLQECIDAVSFYYDDPMEKLYVDGLIKI